MKNFFKNIPEQYHNLPFFWMSVINLFQDALYYCYYNPDLWVAQVKINWPTQFWLQCCQRLFSPKIDYLKQKMNFFLYSITDSFNQTALMRLKNNEGLIDGLSLSQIILPLLSWLTIYTMPIIVLVNFWYSTTVLGFFELVASAMRKYILIGQKFSPLNF